MGLNWEFSGANTPLDLDEADGLRIPTVITRGELDEYEQANIQRARLWLSRSKWSPDRLLQTSFIKQLHWRMYDEVWKWAGQFRRTEKNIGVDPLQISRELQQLLGDVSFWVENDTYQPDELVIRAKHRLVLIHCFPNGNGRHSRLFADMLIRSLGAAPFTWGAFNEMHDVRDRYIEALRKAVKGNIVPLIEFARS